MRKWLLKTALSLSEKYVCVYQIASLAENGLCCSQPEKLNAIVKSHEHCFALDMSAIYEGLFCLILYNVDLHINLRTPIRRPPLISKILLPDTIEIALLA